MREDAEKPRFSRITTRPWAHNIVQKHNTFLNFYYPYINIMVKIYFETYGCTLNKADSEHMAQLLIDNGFEVVDDIQSADVIVVNSCAVKTPTENKILRRIEELQYRYEDKKIIVTGCIAQAYPEKFEGIGLQWLFGRGAGFSVYSRSGSGC
mgnify:CR=1 FL=1